MRPTRKAPKPPYREPEKPGIWISQPDDYGTLTRRQQVLLAAHAARRTLHLYEQAYPGDDRPRLAVEAAEAWADDPSEVNRAAASEAAMGSRRAAADAWDDANVFVGTRAVASVRAAQAAKAAQAASEVAVLDVPVALYSVVVAGIADPSSAWRSYHHARTPEGASFSPDWLTPEVENLARSIYAHRDWEGLPVLADALEEAGCSDQRILLPLRHGRDHSRASWALQQILHGGQ